MLAMDWFDMRVKLVEEWSLAFGVKDVICEVQELLDEFLLVAIWL